MEEGRRMFQIFAARMFEQRVLTAYREEVCLLYSLSVLVSSRLTLPILSSFIGRRREAKPTLA